MQSLEGKYFINEVNVEELRKTYGTPLYVYDGQAIENQINVFKNAFSGVDLNIKYACKALTNLSILKLMRKNGLGLDTVSIPEIRMGLEMGFEPSQIVFTPNCVDFEEIVQGVDLGVQINIENISNLEKFGKKYGGSVPVCIRLNPNISVQQNADKVSWWHNQSKFGISVDQLPLVKELEEKYAMSINGIHIHSSSVIMSTDVFLKASQTVFDIAMDFKNLAFVDFGGGIKLDVGDGNEVVDLPVLAAAFQQQFKSFCDRYGRSLALWFEPGRYLVGNAGYLLTTCQLRKRNGGTEFAGVDSGLNHLIRPMFYGAYHGVINASNPSGTLNKYTIVGNICEIDNLAKDRMLPEVREGDLIVFQSAGAYGFSMASNYNSRFRPAEVLVYNGKSHLIRKRETFDDLLRNQVVLTL